MSSQQVSPPAGLFPENAGRISLTSSDGALHNAPTMKQKYHTIIRPARKGYVGWVEEVPGAITQGTSLEECRRNLRDALTLLLETHRDEARRAMDESCIEEDIEVDLTERRDHHARRPAQSVA